MQFWHHLHDYFFPHPRNNYRPHLFSGASIAVLVAAIILFEGAYLVQTKLVFFKTDFLASVLPAVLVALTNQDRAQNGLAGVVEDPLLSKAAQAAAFDMAANGYFSHLSPDGKTPWYWLEQTSYAYRYAGQNLAVNFTDSENVETAWMESPTHRANIMKPEYTHVGFGTANGIYEGRETTFVVEFFATPAEAKVSASASTVVADLPSAEPAPAVAVQVLGSQAVGVDAGSAAAAPHWLARLLTSPLHTLFTVFSILFAIIAAVFATVVLKRTKVQHPNVLIGGTLLLILIGALMLLASVQAGTLQLNSGTQTAAIGAAFLN